MSEKKTGLDLLREPFPPHQISKLPKPTKAQTDAVKADYKNGFRCKECGGWHHKDVVHLDYVGHAALTDRLLDADPNWNWEPMALENGLPRFDGGGLWIKLIVCNQTRLGYGHADGKTGGDAIKEAIGDALRNAAMRFGAALDLWHKGDLHIEEKPEPLIEKPQPVKKYPQSIVNFPEHSPPPLMDESEQIDSIVDDLPKREVFMPGDYVMQFGKTKGKKLSDIPEDMLKSTLTWCKAQAKPGVNVVTTQKFIEEYFRTK